VKELQCSALIKRFGKKLLRRSAIRLRTFEVCVSTLLFVDVDFIHNRTIYAQLFIGRFRKPSPVPFGLSANHAKRRLGPLTAPSGSIGFQVMELKQYQWFVVLHKIGRAAHPERAAVGHVYLDHGGLHVLVAQ